MSKATTSKKSKGGEKVKVNTEVTHEEAKVYVQKIESRIFLNDEEESEELVVPDGDFVFDHQAIAQLGYDSDNDDTILRGEAENDNGVTLSDAMNDSPDFNDSDDDEENIKALKNKYKAAQKANA